MAKVDETQLRIQLVRAQLEAAKSAVPSEGGMNAKVAINKALASLAELQKSLNA